MNQNNTKVTEDITLQELILSVWNRKWWIIIFTIVCTGLAALYTTLATPTYRSEVELLPPTRADLASYNLAIQLAGPAITDLVSANKTKPDYLAEITPNETYQLFLRHLTSYSTRLDFFNTVYLPSLKNSPEDNDKEQSWNEFSRKLSIVPPAGTVDLRSTLSFAGPDSAQNAEWANQFVHMAEDKASEELIQGVQSLIDIRRQVTKDQIQALKNAAESERKSKIKRLNDALQLAESIGLNEPPTQGNLVTSYSDENLYLRGTNALKAEIAVTEQRLDNDPYIAELNDLLKKQALLDAIEVDAEHLKVATIDRTATPAQYPIWPRRSLILVLGFALSLGLSTLLLLFISAFFPNKNASRRHRPNLG